MKLDSTTIVLTGGSSGIGLDLLRLLSPRCHVINLSRREPEIEGKASFTHIPTDLSDSASVAAALAQILSAQPSGVDGLINCAAVQFTPRFAAPDFDPAAIGTEIAINFTSPIELVAGLLPGMLDRPEAFVLNVNSGLGIVPKHESAVYCATKGGLANFTRGLRAQLHDTDIAVQQTFLPLVDTPMTEGRGAGKITSQRVAQQIIRQIEGGAADVDIGKAKLLRVINRLSPTLANRIMQKGNA